MIYPTDYCEFMKRFDKLDNALSSMTQVSISDENWNILKYWLKDNYDQTNYSLEEKDLLSVIISKMIELEEK